MKLYCGKEYTYGKSAKKHIKNCDTCSWQWLWSEDYEKNLRRLKRRDFFIRILRWITRRK